MRRLSSILVALVVAVVPASPAGATTTPPAASAPSPDFISTSATWTRSTSGPAVVWDAVAFAPSVCRLVTFGGNDSPRVTNLFNPANGAWSIVAAQKNGPPARSLGRMAWDPVHKRVVLFGGRNAAGTALQDTWSFDPSSKTWSPLVTNCRKNTCPPARYAHGMVWSSVLGKLVVFGGERDWQTFLGDLWSFDGTRWQKLTTNAGPSARYLFGMAEDAKSGKILVYGGLEGPSDTDIADPATWILDAKAATWTRTPTATVPEPRMDLGMAWLASIGAVVVSTGSDRTGCMSWTDSTWAFDMTAKDWVRVSTSGSLPTARNAANLTANPCDGSAILSGGTGTNDVPIDLEDRTWVLE